MPEVDSSSWPMPCSPNWISESCTPDPFFIEYLRMLCDGNQGNFLFPLWDHIFLIIRFQGFAGMTPLHEAILAHDTTSFERWLTRAQPDERNSLGQTPLHLAVSRPQFLNALIRKGHDANAVDKHGITPLMYAAATNERDALSILIRSGADLSIVCSLNKRDFVAYALVRCNWKLMLDSLQDIEATSGARCAKMAAQSTTVHFLLKKSFSPELAGLDTNELLDQLLVKCGSVNFLYHGGTEGFNNNCLMHAVNSATEVETILKHGFALINHTNSSGQHPLIRAVRWSDGEVVRSLVAAGADVNLKDMWDRTSLYYNFADLQRNPNDFADMRIFNLHTLLSHDANTLSRDRCRCPCSPGGCLPTAPLAHVASADSSWGQTNLPVWSLEVLNTLEELRGQGEAKVVLLSLIRKATFDELDMTHVCCQRQTPSSWWGPPGSHPDPISDDDINEIQDEESEFIDLLEESMNHYVARSFDELVEDWGRLIGKSLTVEINKADDHNKDIHKQCQVVSTIPYSERL